jgi:hypothetical protein
VWYSDEASPNEASPNEASPNEASPNEASPNEASLDDVSPGRGVPRTKRPKDEVSPWRSVLVGTDNQSPIFFRNTGETFPNFGGDASILKFLTLIVWRRIILIANLNIFYLEGICNTISKPTDLGFYPLPLHLLSHAPLIEMKTSVYRPWGFRLMVWVWGEVCFESRHRNSADTLKFPLLFTKGGGDGGGCTLHSAQCTLHTVHSSVSWYWNCK